MGALIGIYTIFAGLSLVVTIVVLVIIIKTIVNIIENDEINNNSKIFWIILILVTNIIGLIVYLITKNKNVLTQD